MEKVIQEFKSALMGKLGGDIVLMQLFGSRARGDAGPDSDADVLIVLKDPTETQKDFIDDLTMALAGKHELYLSAIILSEKEFKYYQSIPSLFIRNVLSEGIKLV